MAFFLEIAIPVPLTRRFDYLPCDDFPQSESYLPGQRVRVEFANRLLTGVVIATHSSSDAPVDKLRPVLEVLDQQPVIDKAMLNLCRWLSDYYHASLGQVLELALPAMLRKGAALTDAHEAHWQRCADFSDCNKLRSQQQKQLWQRFEHDPIIAHQALLNDGYKKPQMNRLAELGLIEDIQQLPIPPYTSQCQPPLPLNSEQQRALDQFDKMLTQFSVGLLEGVTGSGKTEVYLQLIQKAIEQQQQCLILVPEIGLTPQTMARFRQRFNVPMVMLHSGINDRQRLQGWEQARQGLAQIVIGTRSAIFTPLPNLGLIIIDEEHDASFKQQDGVRYSARDFALMRARHHHCPVILGSATPSLESLHNAHSGRYQHARLTQRANNARRPAITIQTTLNQPLTAGLTQPVLAAIQKRLNQAEQVLIFLNRRGFAPLLACQDCGWMADCRRCDARMTLHQQPPYLHCHHCDNKLAVPAYCPSCHSPKLEAVGRGTERVQQQLQQLFPSVPVTRVDRDTVRSKQAFEQLYQSILEGDAGILVGTQMLAKGHHFPRVTLVVVLDSDNGLFSPDFRGMEFSAQLIEQVSGRAGRAEKAGEVWVQTMYPDHPQLNRLIQDGYSALSEELLRERQQLQLPPFSHQAMIRSEAENAEHAEQALTLARTQIQQWLQHTDQAIAITLVGPFPAMMERCQGRYRFALQCFCASRKQLHRALDVVNQVLQSASSLRKVRWHIDVDPLDSI